MDKESKLKGFIDRIRRFFNQLVEFVVVFVITVLGYTIVLSFYKMIWALYSETYVGGKFMLENLLLFNTINDIINKNLFLFSFNTAVTVIKICFLIAVISHICFLKRRFYDPRGIIGRVLYIGLPCTAVTAFYSQATNWGLAFFIYLVPTLALFSCCFNLVTKLLPETDDLLKYVFKAE